VTGVPVEVQLIAVAVLFYLYDATVMLSAHEGLAIAAGKRSWRIVYRPNTVALRGRLAYVPAPILPHRPVFKLRWSATALSVRDDTDWNALRNKYRPLVPFVYGAAVALFVVLPGVLFAYRSDLRLLCVAAAIYLDALAAGVIVIRNTQRFGLTRRKAWSTAVECLLCPPFTINLVRRLSLNEHVDASLAAVGRGLLAPDAWNRLRLQLIEIQDEYIEDAEPGQTHAALVQVRAALAKDNDRDGR
jgi:hypothetical protein